MPGVIDSGYRGELFVGVTNLKKYAGEKTVVRKGDRLAQLIPMRLASHELRAVEVEELNDHERGIKGFGSTGR
jgi:dUTP pyrophosphatase